MYKIILGMLCGLVLCATTSHAQTFDLKFELVLNNGSQYQVKVQILSSSVFNMGASNIRFNYNSSALGSPSLITAHNYGASPYLPMTVTGAAGIASVNITLIPPTTGDPVSSTVWTDIATVGFSVTNSSGSSNLVFRSTSATTPATVVLTDLGLQLTENNLYPLNTSPLPVELISFSGYDRGDRVHLHWETATEFENYGFEIQRQEEGEEWTAIGFVPGKGTVNYPVIYDWDDMLEGLLRPPAYQDKLRYRLRQIDRDGTDDLSPVIEVAMNAAAEHMQLDVYPNPCVNNTTVACALRQDEVVTLTVHDAAGREVQRVLDARQLHAGSHVFDLPTDALTNGMYVLRLLAGGRAYVEHFAVVR